MKMQHTSISITKELNLYTTEDIEACYPKSLDDSMRKSFPYGWQQAFKYDLYEQQHKTAMNLCMCYLDLVALRSQENTFNQ